VAVQARSDGYACRIIAIVLKYIVWCEAGPVSTWTLRGGEQMFQRANTMTVVS